MDLKKFLEFYKNPPAEWIAIKREHKFKTKNSLRIPNPEWKPFINTGRKNNEDTGKSLIPIFFIFYSFLLA